MQSPYRLAEEKLAEIRNENEEKLIKRKEEVALKCPEYPGVQQRLLSCGVALSKCVLGSGGNIDVIKKAAEDARLEKKKILSKLNLPENYLDPIYDCQKCRDTGFDENGRRCSCLKALISKYMGVNSNLSHVMKTQTFENFDFNLFEEQPDVKGRSVGDVIKRAYDISVKFAENMGCGENLYFYGDAGKGKTYLSSCIANRVLEKGFSVYYNSSFALLEMMEKLKFNRVDEDQEESVAFEAKYVYDVDLLIIDDVGTEFVSGYTSAAMYDIINSRINSGKSTVISSNLSPSGINNLYGERMASRISGVFRPVPFIGRDLRQAKRMKAKRD